MIMNDKKTLLQWCEELREITDVDIRTVLSLDQSTCEEKIRQMIEIYRHIVGRMSAVNRAVTDGKSHLSRSEQRRFHARHNPHYCCMNSMDEWGSYAIAQLKSLGIDYRAHENMSLNLLLNMMSMRAFTTSFLRYLHDEKVIDTLGARYARDIKTGLRDCDEDEED